MSTYHNSELGIGPTKNVLEHLEDLRRLEKQHQQEIAAAKISSDTSKGEKPSMPVGRYLNTN